MSKQGIKNESPQVSELIKKYEELAVQEAEIKRQRKNLELLTRYINSEDFQFDFQRWVLGQTQQLRDDEDGR